MARQSNKSKRERIVGLLTERGNDLDCRFDAQPTSVGARVSTKNPLALALSCSENRTDRGVSSNGPRDAVTSAIAESKPRRPSKPLEVLLPLAERERIRADVLARAPSWYNPWVHLAVPSFFGLGVILASILLLRDLRAIELLTVPIVYVLTNMNEWYIHRDLLHRRNPLAKVLYDRHTPEHHMIYVTDDMAMRDRREFRLVLIPAYGLFLIFVNLLPITAALWFLLGRNVALLYTATAMGYSVSYEWLHLSYHLPATSRVGGSRIIRKLRRHHAVHHDPRLMQRWNFNVTIPLWDWVRGTIVKDYPRQIQVTTEGGPACASEPYSP
jgi:hypothetical protein